MPDNIVVPTQKDQCCGCGVCASICPKFAIKIECDEEGFYYPVVNEDKCTSCGICTHNCAFSNRIRPLVPDVLPHCFIAKHQKEDVRMNSRSGGVFVACSDWILENGGVVYGCILNDSLKAVHARAETIEQRNYMCKSKYVQSELGNLFQNVLQDLKDGKMVLFSGTGCQVDGLLFYLRLNNEKMENLYTMDIVCHGCMSPQIYADFISWLERKHKGKVTAFDFRAKTVCGWDGYIELAIINGKKYTSVIYRELFHVNLGIRPSCYNCKYASIERLSDITIADAWGIKKAKPEFNDNRGVSMTLVNSEKGAKLLDAMKGACDVVEMPLDDFMQINLQQPSTPKGDREQYWRIYRSGGIDALINAYGHLGLKKSVKAKVKYLARKVLQGKKYYLP